MKGFGIKVSVPQEAKSALNKSAQDNGTQGPEKTEARLSPSPSTSPNASQTVASDPPRTGVRADNLDNTPSGISTPQKLNEVKKEQEQEPAPDND